MDNLTIAARAVLELAAREAAARCTRVDAIHLLLALVREPNGGAARIFRELGVSAAPILREVEPLAWLEPSRDAPGDRTFGPRAVRALDLAAEEGLAGNHELVDTDH